MIFFAVLPKCSAMTYGILNCIRNSNDVSGNGMTTESKFVKTCRYDNREEMNRPHKAQSTVR